MRRFHLLGSLPTHVIIIFSCLLYVHAQDQYPLIWKCPSELNFTSNSPFHTNLNRLLSSLVPNGAPDGFYNTTIGSEPNTVYGLVSCRGDLSMEDCRACLNISTAQAAQSCPNGRVASILYDSCLLRYSNRNFFSQVDNSPWYFLANSRKMSDAVYNRQVGDLISNLSKTAASTQARYASGSESGNVIGVYGYAQCTRDMSPKSCLSCLQSMSAYKQICCSGSQGARIFSTICNMRFELYPFLEAPTASPTRRSRPLPRNGNDGGGKSTSVLLIVVPTVAALVLLAICGYLVTRRIGKKIKQISYTIDDEDDIRSEESLQFELNAIRIATNDFSDANKLGEGGFGAVYRGKLLDGQMVAVKRLSKMSGQGSQEFKNEVVLLHKLQHRNLVRLLGFCLAGEEKLLIYEYVPNRSLDKYISVSRKKENLDWEMRHKIIGGIARGLVYLHEDSRLRIIHRDLKAGNILLDEDMNAKIADFGMAKVFGVDQTQGNTRRIAGTFGYMAPEYAMHGLFSVKSDVFSFGVLLLEITSGEKINNFHLSGHSVDLRSYAWKLWSEGDALKLIDPTLMDNYVAHEVMRCIHIALLCIQDNNEERPTMSSVVSMLNTYSLALASPSAPAFKLVIKTNNDDASRDDMDFCNSAGSSLMYSFARTDPR